MSTSGISGKTSGERPGQSGAAKKFHSVNINNTYSGKSHVGQKSSVVPKHGLQSLGKTVAVARRMPPPANLPSLKAEQDPSQVSLVPSDRAGWGTQQSSENQAQAVNAAPQGAQKTQTPSTAQTTGGPTETVGWAGRKTTGGDATAVSQVSTRDFPKLSSTTNSTGAHERSPLPNLGTAGQPILRPQNVGSWKSGGGQHLQQQGDNVDDKPNSEDELSMHGVVDKDGQSYPLRPASAPYADGLNGSDGRFQMHPGYTYAQQPRQPVGPSYGSKGPRFGGAFNRDLSSSYDGRYGGSKSNQSLHMQSRTSDDKLGGYQSFNGCQTSMGSSDTRPQLVSRDDAWYYDEYNHHDRDQRGVWSDDEADVVRDYERKWNANVTHQTMSGRNDRNHYHSCSDTEDTPHRMHQHPSHFQAYDRVAPPSLPQPPPYGYDVSNHNRENLFDGRNNRMPFPMPPPPSMMRLQPKGRGYGPPNWYPNYGMQPSASAGYAPSMTQQLSQHQGRMNQVGIPPPIILNNMTTRPPPMMPTSIMTQNMYPPPRDFEDDEEEEMVMKQVKAHERKRDEAIERGKQRRRQAVQQQASIASANSDISGPSAISEDINRLRLSEFGGHPRDRNDMVDDYDSEPDRSSSVEDSHATRGLYNKNCRLPAPRFQQQSCQPKSQRENLAVASPGLPPQLIYPAADYYHHLPPPQAYYDRRNGPPSQYYEVQSADEYNRMYYEQRHQYDALPRDEYDMPLHDNKENLASQPHKKGSSRQRHKALENDLYDLPRTILHRPESRDSVSSSDKSSRMSAAEKSNVSHRKRNTNEKPASVNGGNTGSSSNRRDRNIRKTVEEEDELEPMETLSKPKVTKRTAGGAGSAKKETSGNSESQCTVTDKDSLIKEQRTTSTTAASVDSLNDKSDMKMLKQEQSDKEKPVTSGLAANDNETSSLPLQKNVWEQRKEAQQQKYPAEQIATNGKDADDYWLQDSLSNFADSRQSDEKNRTSQNQRSLYRRGSASSGRHRGSGRRTEFVSSSRIRGSNRYPVSQLRGSFNRTRGSSAPSAVTGERKQLKGLMDEEIDISQIQGFKKNAAKNSNNDRDDSIVSENETELESEKINEQCFDVEVSKPIVETDSTELDNKIDSLDLRRHDRPLPPNRGPRGRDIKRRSTSEQKQVVDDFDSNYGRNYGRTVRGRGGFSNSARVWDADNGGRHSIKDNGMALSGNSRTRNDRKRRQHGNMGNMSKIDYFEPVDAAENDGVLFDNDALERNEYKSGGKYRQSVPPRFQHQHYYEDTSYARNERGGFAYAGRLKSGRGRGVSNRGKRSIRSPQGNAKDAIIDPANDEWETASESSDVGERRDRKRENKDTTLSSTTNANNTRSRPSTTNNIQPVFATAAASVGPKSFSSQRQQRRNQRHNGNSTANSNTGDTTTKFGNVTHRGKKAGEDGAEYHSKNVKAASDQATASDKSGLRNSRRTAAAPADRWPSGGRSAERPDALAEVDLNNIASVVVIDDQPDSHSAADSVDGFQVVSRKRHKKDSEEKKSQSPVRNRFNSKTGKNGKSRHRSDTDRADNIENFTQLKTSVFVSSSVAPLPDVNMWDQSSHGVDCGNDGKKKMVSNKRFSRMNDKNASVGDDGVQFGASKNQHHYQELKQDSRRTNESVADALPSKTGVEIWGTPDPVSSGFLDSAIGNEETANAQLMPQNNELNATKINVELSSAFEDNLGKVNSDTPEMKLDFTFDPALGSLDSEHKLQKAQSGAQLVSPSAEDLNQKIVSCKNLWDPKEMIPAVNEETSSIHSGHSGGKNRGDYSGSGYAELEADTVVIVSSTVALETTDIDAQDSSQQQVLETQQSSPSIMHSSAAVVATLPSVGVANTISSGMQPMLQPLVSQSLGFGLPGATGNGAIDASGLFTPTAYQMEYRSNTANLGGNQAMYAAAHVGYGAVGQQAPTLMLHSQTLAAADPFGMAHQFGTPAPGPFSTISVGASNQNSYFPASIGPPPTGSTLYRSGGVSYASSSSQQKVGGMSGLAAFGSQSQLGSSLCVLDSSNPPPPHPINFNQPPPLTNVSSFGSQLVSSQRGLQAQHSNLFMAQPPPTAIQLNPGAAAASGFLNSTTSTAAGALNLSQPPPPFPPSGGTSLSSMFGGSHKYPQNYAPPHDLAAWATVNTGPAMSSSAMRKSSTSGSNLANGHKTLNQIFAAAAAVQQNSSASSLGSAAASFGLPPPPVMHSTPMVGVMSAPSGFAIPPPSSAQLASARSSCNQTPIPNGRFSAALSSASAGSGLTASAKSGAAGSLDVHQKQRDKDLLQDIDRFINSADEDLPPASRAGMCMASLAAVNLMVYQPTVAGADESLVVSVDLPAEQ